jgi:hypothetical protein
MKSSRYQDLSREQAFGLETRILHRLGRLLVARKGAGRDKVDEFFARVWKLKNVGSTVASVSAAVSAVMSLISP